MADAQKSFLAREIASRVFAGAGFGAALGLFAIVPWSAEWSSKSVTLQWTLIGVVVGLASLAAIIVAIGSGPYWIESSSLGAIGALFAVLSIAHLFDWRIGWIGWIVAAVVCVVSGVLATSTLLDFIGWGCLAGALSYLLTGSWPFGLLIFMLALAVLVLFALLSRASASGTILLFSSITALVVALFASTHLAGHAQQMVTDRLLVNASATEIFNGSNYSDGKPVLFHPQALAVSADAEQIAILDQTGLRSAAVWIFSANSTKKAAVSVDMVAPSYTTANLYRFDDGDLSAGYTQAVSGNSGALPDALSRPDNDLVSTFNTYSMAFDGNVLYGVTPTVLWKLEPDGHLKKVRSWTNNLSRSISLLRPGELAITSTDRTTRRSSIELVDGSDPDGPSQVIRLATDDGTDLQDIYRRDAQNGYIVTSDESGTLTVIVGEQIVQWTNPDDVKYFGKLPLRGAPAAIASAAAKNSSLVLTDSTDTAYTIEDIASPKKRNESFHFRLDNKAVEQCRDAGIQASLPFDKTVLAGTASKADVLVAVRKVPGSLCTFGLWKTSFSTPSWLQLNHVEPTRVSESYAGRIVVGAIGSLSPDGRAFTAPAIDDAFFMAEDDTFRPLPVPTRKYLDSPLLAPVKLGETYWLPGSFNTKDGGTYSGMVRHTDASGWTQVTPISGVTDSTPARGQVIYVSTCTGIVEYDTSGPRSSLLLEVRGQHQNGCTPRFDPGPNASWDQSLGAPFTIAADEIRSRLLVGETKVATNGSAFASRIAQINLKTREVSSITGGDLTDLGVVPTDVNVAGNGQICVTTALEGDAGPIVVIEPNGVRKVLRVGGDYQSARFTTCAFKDNRLVAGTADGGIVRVDW